MGRKKQWKRISSVFSNGRPVSSVHLTREYLEEFPDDAFAWLVLGGSLTSLMRFDEARSALTRAVRLLPPERADYAYRELGHLYREKGSLTTAERWYRKALELRPDHDGYEIYLGTCLWRQGKVAEAREHLARAVELDSEVRAEAYFNLGGLNLTEERYDEAAECYEKALEIDPKDKAAKRALADVNRARKLARKTAKKRADPE